MKAVPVHGGSTDGGDGGVDPRPEHRHPPAAAVRRTQDKHAVVHQVGSSGQTGHRVEHWRRQQQQYFFSLF